MPETLEIRVVLNEATPVYRQILNQLRSLCVEGRLPPGEKLPSVRDLARSLGVHFNTVAEAYRLLGEEGWLAVEHGRGARVADRQVPMTPTAATQAEQRSRLRHLIAELRAKGLDADWIRREVATVLEVL